MSFKWIGAVMVIAGCGGVGFSMAAGYWHEERSLRTLMRALEYMSCELQFHLTPLPQLLRQTGTECGGIVGTLLRELARELDHQVTPDADSCMYAALSRVDNIPPKTMEAMRLLGSSLGRFDLAGQLQGLEQIRSRCSRELDRLTTDRDQRIRGYQTLGLCAGAALAILFV